MLGVVLKVFILPGVVLVGVVVLKEVASCTVFCISILVVILPVMAVDGVMVLKEVVSCAFVPVVLCVLV